jgi:hypothetical protein
MDHVNSMRMRVRTIKLEDACQKHIMIYDHSYGTCMQYLCFGGE